MRSFWTLVVVAAATAALSACGGSDSSPSRWPWAVRVGPSILSVEVPLGNVHGFEPFTFSAETVGAPVVSWHWDFGGGTEPNTSNLPAPVVTLINYWMTESAFYTCTLTVTDADGNSDTVQAEYQVAPVSDNDPQFEWGPTFYRGNPATIVFSVSDWGIGNEVVVTIEVVEGEGVTVEPTTMTVPLDSGPYEVTVINHMLWDIYATLRITLDNGYYQTSSETTGIIYGFHPQPGSIAIQPNAATVRVGETVLIEVYVFDILYPAAYFWVALPYCDGLQPVSWNLGRSGGDTWDKDGPFWDEFPDSVWYCPYPRILFEPDWIELDMWAEGENPIGAPAGTSGPLCNLEFEAVEPGTWFIDFISEGTSYGEPDEETWHYYTDYLGCEVTVTETKE